MQIVLVTEAEEILISSMTKSRERLETARALAAAENERYSEALTELDPEDPDLLPEERIEVQFKIDSVEENCALLWKRYEKALIRYGYDLAAAQKAGLISAN